MCVCVCVCVYTHVRACPVSSASSPVEVCMCVCLCLRACDLLQHLGWISVLFPVHHPRVEGGADCAPFLLSHSVFSAAARPSAVNRRVFMGARQSVAVSLGLARCTAMFKADRQPLAASPAALSLSGSEHMPWSSPYRLLYSGQSSPDGGLRTERGAF